MMQVAWILLLPVLFFLPVQPLLAQSPNTSTILVLVTDQSGAVVAGAKVSVTNNQTGASREATSGSDGASTMPALSLTGTYTVNVSKQGFGSEERNDVTLRAGETATLRVKLLVGSEKSEVTVYGTAAGVRADPQIGRRLDSATADETPILGRKISTLPLFNSAFRQAKGTGDLFVNAT
ncbi:MAG: carboxypeptidase-like regulatory domain-containing protein, partial [Vicinamibacterales bacterium]